MRREGYEFQVSRPEVILREGPGGETLEPFEEVHIETPPETVGVVVEMLGGRRGQMMNMLDSGGSSSCIRWGDRMTKATAPGPAAFP